MKLIHIVGLMICLSILVVMPVCANSFDVVYVSSVQPSGMVNNLTTVVVNFPGAGWPFDPRGYCSDNDNTAITETRAAGKYTNVGFSGVYFGVGDGCAAGQYCFVTTAQGYDGTGCANDGGYYKIGYYEGVGAFDFHSVVSMEYGLPTVLPNNESYSFEISPDTVNLKDAFTGTVTSTNISMQGLEEMTINYFDANGNNQPMKEWNSTSKIASYTKLSGLWYGWNLSLSSYNNLKGSTFPSIVTSIADMGLGTYTFTCNLRMTNGTWFAYTDTLTVGTSASLNYTQRLILEATDAFSNALVSDTNINVLNKATEQWQNVTTTSGVYDFWVPYNSNLYIEGTAGGYNKATKNWTVLPYSSYILKLPMYPSGTIAATNVSLNVVVLDGATSGVFSNAQVRLSDGQVKSTSGAGVATFTVLAAKSYQIIASYSGYSSATRTLTTTAGGTSQDTYLTLNRIVVTTAPTLPPGVTAVVTLDTRTNAQKDLDMMNQIREYAPMLITLAMLMTMMYLVGYKP